LNRKLKQTFIIITHERPQFGEVDKVVTIKDGRILEEEELETSSI